MPTDKILTAAAEVPPWALGVVAAVVLALLVLAAWALRKRGKGKAASWISTAATLLGMAWSAQGMWDTAVNEYEQTEQVAWVLFVVFEAFVAGRMLQAYRYRTDLPRRAKFVRAVWIGACIMAAVVALGEGWSQAPGRLAIPLLVAYGWYTDLTADDDPDAEKQATSFRLTPRRIGLALRLLEPRKQDIQTLDRDRLRDSLTKLAFRIQYAPDWLSTVLRREMRLARLKTLAEDADLAEVRARLARMRVSLIDDEPAAAPAPAVPSRLAGPLPSKAISLDRRVQGVHMRLGRRMRGSELEDDAVRVMRASITADRPNGMTAAELAGVFEPPLGIRKAEDFAAKGRREYRANGQKPSLTT